jgi:hypothetical protein
MPVTADDLDAAHCFAAAEAAEGAIGRLSTIRAALSVDVPLQNNVP